MSPRRVVELGKRMAAQADLRESERRYAALLESIDGIVWESDPRTFVFSFVSAKAERLSGYPIERWLKEPGFWASHIHPEDRERAVNFCMQQTAAGLHHDLEYRMLTTDGSSVWLHDRVSVETRDGKPVALRGVMVDITRRKRAEEALRGSEARYRMLVEHSPVCIHEIDREGALISMNRSGLAMMGVADERQIQGTRYLDSVASADRARIGELLQRALLGDSSEFEFESVNRREFQSSFVPIRDSGGAVARLIGLTQDITERKRIEHELRKSSEYLRALSRRLVQVQEIERHELARELHDRVGQNLTALAINLDILRGGGEPRERVRRLDDSLNLVEATAQAIHSAIAELRPPMLDDYGLAAALRWYGGQYQARTNIAVTVSGPEEAASTPRPERDLALFRIAQEALNNVAKHAGARGVVITLREGSEGSVLAVSDDGRGFDPAPRGQSDPSLGMSTMRERAMAVGGTVEIESATDRGTTVTVRAPS